MQVKRLPKFDASYVKLPTSIQKKVRKNILILSSNLRHPSLHVKKMRGIDAYEARVDIHYRMTFDIVGDILELYVVGMHDKGLGKK